MKSIPDPLWTRINEVLTDAAFMLQDIKRARNLPAFAQVHDQYISLGKDIDLLIKQLDTVTCTEQSND